MNPEISSNSNQDEARVRVRRVRRASHVAQGAVAAEADLDTSTLCLWELGKVTLSPAKVTEIEESLLKVIAGRLRAIEEVVAVST